MNCPICNVTLIMSEKQGVEIDYCPKCRGVWLDRGELDKIIERSTPDGQYRNYGSNQSFNQQHDDDDHHKYQNDSNNYEHQKQKSWLSNLFD
jgi:Zn-finger nucleic acid-binding protein